MSEVQSEFMTVEEVAAMLRLNRKTIYDAVKHDELPGAKNVRGTIRIRRETVVAWFDTGKGSVKQRKPSK